MDLKKLCKVNSIQTFGGSKYIAIPVEMCKAFEIEKGDGIAFFWSDDEKKQIIIEKVG
jgi:hypothetical protein